jgi:hypothetical protein
MPALVARLSGSVRCHSRLAQVSGRSQRDPRGQDAEEVILRSRILRDASLRDAPQYEGNFSRENPDPHGEEAEPTGEAVSNHGGPHVNNQIEPDSRGARPQIVVPRGAWQAARPLGAWTLVGCTVSPAFSFEGFELAPEGWSPEIAIRP